MNIWIYPGTFDPIVLGHEDIIKRSASLCEKLIITVIDNYNKSPIFSVEERIYFLKKVCAGISNVDIVHIKESTAKFALEINANAIVRGIRTSSDFDNEMILLKHYFSLNPNIETIFLPETNIMTSSTLLKEAVFHGDNIDKIINPSIKDIVVKKLINS